MPSGPPFAFLPHLANAGGGPERVGATHPGPRRSSSSTLGSGQLSGRCPEAPSPPPTSSGIGCRWLVGGPRVRIKLRVSRAPPAWGFSHSGQKRGALSLRPGRSSLSDLRTRLPSPASLRLPGPALLEEGVKGRAQGPRSCPGRLGALAPGCRARGAV